LFESGLKRTNNIGFSKIMNILSVGVGVATEIGLEHVSLVEADISTKRDWMARYIPRNDVTVSLLRGMFLIVKTIFYSKLLIE